ncbi:hypothetical protein ATANTOWER_027536, partial [Ataeniobius toweri]|nr:hypothetical protein [Ataeniobius toweri]
ISSQALLRGVGLHNLSFSERNLSTLQQVAPLDQISKETTNQSSDLWKESVIKVTRLTKLSRPGITPLRRTSTCNKRREVPVPDPTSIRPVNK